VRWHRAGFRFYWRWRSCRRGGRPQIETELRALIRLISMENPLWGAPRIHGEMLKLGFEVAQSSVAKYMVKRRGRQARDGAPFCVIMLKILPPWTCSLSRPLASTCSTPTSRELVWIGVTTHPTAEWVARQITEAFPWNEAPRYMIRDQDRIYGAVVTRR
jgi:hypothetical protein